MDLDTIGYFLFMQEQEEKQKQQEDEDQQQEDSNWIIGACFVSAAGQAPMPSLRPAPPNGETEQGKRTVKQCRVITPQFDFQKIFCYNFIRKTKFEV